VQFLLDDLVRIMRSSAGVDDSVDLTGDIADVSFTDLGYDSLAVLEITGRVARERQIALTDDEVQELYTVRELLDLVNSRLGERV